MTTLDGRLMVMDEAIVRSALYNLILCRAKHNANLVDPKATTAAFVESRDAMLSAWAAAEASLTEGVK